MNQHDTADQLNACQAALATSSLDLFEDYVLEFIVVEDVFQSAGRGDGIACCEFFHGGLGGHYDGYWFCMVG